MNIFIIVLLAFVVVLVFVFSLYRKAHRGYDIFAQSLGFPVIKKAKEGDLSLPHISILKYQAQVVSFEKPSEAELPITGIFGSITRLIKPDPHFAIFFNKVIYNTHIRRGEREIRDSLCFLFDTPSIKGRHRIVVNPIAKNFEHYLTDLAVGDHLLKHEGMRLLPAPPEKYLYLTSDEAELNRIIAAGGNGIGQLHGALGAHRLGWQPMDYFVAEAIVDFCEGKTLVRTSFRAGNFISEIYPLIRELERQLKQIQS